MRAFWEEYENEDYLDIGVSESEWVLLPKRTICHEFVRDGKLLKRHKILHIGIFRDDGPTEEELYAAEVRKIEESRKRKYFGA